MDERLSTRRAALALAGVGLLVAVLSFPLSGGGCSGVESLNPNGAYRLLWFDASALQLYYTPNGGLSRCHVGVGALTLPIGVGAAGLGTCAAGVDLAASRLGGRPPT